MSKRSVWKFELPLTNGPGEVTTLTLPKGAKVLKVDTQGVDPILGPQFFVWALVNPEEKEKETRDVVTAGTGHTIPTETMYRVCVSRVGSGPVFQETVMALGGSLVIHVWISAPTPEVKS